jgi:predicted DNA-binding protein YlxM (UPF0122 family)
MPISMDKRNRMVCLFDCYGNLLTEKQKKLFQYYFDDDLSLAEISQMEGISRQAVHDSISKCETSLEDYEAKLHLYSRFSAQDALAEETAQCIEESLKNGQWSRDRYSALLQKIYALRKADTDGA